MRLRYRGWFIGLAAAGALVAAGCSSETRADLNEAAARNAIAVAGVKEFRDADHPIDGLLKCTVQSRSTTSVTVGCTGTTDANEEATLIGTTEDATQLKGDFVGSIAGREVFTTSCLAC